MREIREKPASLRKNYSLGTYTPIIPLGSQEIFWKTTH
jgi:hypothetical protein